jgi:phosphotransferase system  glucose/maltose/N-acetylglucosamine-specific IIC component
MNWASRIAIVLSLFHMIWPPHQQSLTNLYSLLAAVTWVCLAIWGFETRRPR